MGKRIWSAMLLCVAVIMFFLTVWICVNAVMSMIQMDELEFHAINDALPGASILAVALTTVSIWGGTLLLGGCTAAIGWVSSLINIKIACSPVIKAVSVGFLCVFSAVLVIGAAALSYFIFCII